MNVTLILIELFIKLKPTHGFKLFKSLFKRGDLFILGFKLYSKPENCFSINRPKLVSIIGQYMGLFFEKIKSQRMQTSMSITKLILEIYNFLPLIEGSGLKPVTVNKELG